MLEFIKLIGSLLANALNALRGLVDIVNFGLPNFLAMMGVLPRVVFSTAVVMLVIAILAAILGRIKN